MSKYRRRFASETEVPASRSRAELEDLLVAAGAYQVGIAKDTRAKKVFVVFGLDARRVRLTINTEPTEKHRKDLDLEQYERAAWRRLILVVKAKLEIIRDGQSTVEREFLADVMLPDGATVGETLGPQLAESYATGRMPPLLPGLGET